MKRVRVRTQFAPAHNIDAMKQKLRRAFHRALVKHAIQLDRFGSGSAKRLGPLPRGLVASRKKP
jgi:hypothetical protein